MTTKKDERGNVKLPPDLYAALAHHAVDERVSIHEVVRMGWDALKAANSQGGSGTGTSSSNGALPNPRSADNIDTLLSVEDLLQKAATKLRMLRESANGSVDPVSEVGESEPLGEKLGRIVESAKTDFGKTETPVVGDASTPEKRERNRANHQ